MADEEVKKNTNISEVAQAKAEIKAQIDEARNPQKSAAEISVAEKLLAEKLLKELSGKSAAANAAKEQMEAAGRMNDSEAKGAVEVKQTLVKVLEAVRLGVINPPTKTKVVL